MLSAPPPVSGWLEFAPWFPSFTFFLLGLGICALLGSWSPCSPYLLANALMLTDKRQ